MRKLIAVAVALTATHAARADAPALLPVQGVLADADGAPVEGDADLQFALYPSAVGGTALWTETQTVLVEDGLFTAYLGTLSTLDLALFRDHDAVFLGVTVGSDPEMDRFEIATTGYAAFAQYAGDAATLGGVAAEDYRTTSGTVDWTDLAGVPPGLADGADADTTYTAGAGLTLTGTAFAADRATLEGWARAVCYDTEAELTALLDDNYRAAGWVPAWTDVTGVPAGFADGTDNDTTYSAGAGLALAGTVFSVNGVTSAMIVDGAVTGADIAVGAIAGSHITTGAVGSAQLATSSVTPAHLTDGTALAEIGDDDGAGSGLDADLLDGVHLASVRSGIEYIGFGSWRSSPTRLVRTAGTITVPASGYVLVLAQGEKSADAGETWAGFIHWNGSDHNADFDYSAAAGWSLWSLQNVFPVSAGTTYVFGVSDSMGGGDGAMDVNCTSVAAVFFPVRL